jgi:hypothetical protein
MGSTLSHEDDGTSERGAHANITIVVSLVGKPRADISPFERRGLNASAARCQ